MMQKGVLLLNVDFIKTLLDFEKRGFTGYIALCIAGLNGLEEGTILYDGGKIVGSFYEYFKLDKTFEGKDAFQRLLNASAAKNGVFDVITLTPEQVKLVLAVNEKTVFVPDQKQFEQVKVKEFSPAFEQEAIETVRRENKGELLKKYKLGDLNIEG